MRNLAQKGIQKARPHPENRKQKNEDSGARTHDLLPVKQALSQLSYVFIGLILTEKHIQRKYKI